MLSDGQKSASFAQETRPRQTEQLHPANSEEVIESLELGLTMKYACLANGVTAETFNNWQADHPELAQIAAEAKARFIQAHLHNIKNVAREGQWTASAWLLERCQSEEFARPEVKIQMLQVNAAADKAANTSLWFQQPSGALPPGDDLEWTCTGLDEGPHVAPALAAPVNSPKVREMEARKGSATAPTQAVEIEAEPVMESGMQAYAQKLNVHNGDVGQIGDAVRQMAGNQFQPGSRVVAARPTPLPDPNSNRLHDGWGDSVQPINWQD
jgi:hypothetical protein